MLYFLEIYLMWCQAGSSVQIGKLERQCKILVAVRREWSFGFGGERDPKRKKSF